MVPCSQIVSNVRTQHEAESSIRWSESAIVDSVNEGLDDLSEVTRFYERHVYVPIANRRTYYDLRGFLPESALGVTSVWSSGIEDWLWPVSVGELKSRWEQAVGLPRHFFMRGLFWMAVFPRPDSTTGSHRVHFAGHAPHFTHPQSVIRDLLPDFVPALEEYALYELAAQDGETTRALMHWGEYSRRAKEIADFVDRRIVSARVLQMGVR